MILELLSLVHPQISYSGPVVLHESQYRAWGHYYSEERWTRSRIIPFVYILLHRLRLEYKMYQAI